MKYLLLSVAIISLSCSNDNITPVKSLDGKWIESVNRKDTIIFDPQLNGSSSTYFIFKCDKGISGYKNLYETMYEYRIQNKAISIYNSISSCYCFADYSFDQKGDKIFVENFYDSNSKGEIETFEKLN